MVRTKILISLVLATKDRTVELARFLQGLARQTYPAHELIVVDQNSDDRIKLVLSSYPGMNITHLAAEAGLSRARNVGLAATKGHVIAFPDDDCWYAPDLLERVVGYFESRPDWSGVSGRTTGEQGVRPLWKWDTQAGAVTRRNVWRRVNSNSIFLRKATFGGDLRFDERLGVGAGTPWGSAEEVDLILSALQAGARIEFLPELVVYHEDTFPSGSQSEVEKAYRYACGMGFVLRKHRCPPELIALEVMRPLANTVRAWASGDHYKMQFMAAMARGRIRGLMGSG
jgi:glycosyltransferase involved in cell wall biosynthesis